MFGLLISYIGYTFKSWYFQAYICVIQLKVGFTPENL